MPRNPSIRLAILAASLTIIYLIGLSFNLSPWLRGPEEWRWSYVIPGSLERLWLPALLLAGYLLLVLWWQRRPLDSVRTVLGLLIASSMTVVIQLGLLYLEHEDVRSQLFYRTVSELSGGFFNVGAVVTDNAEFLGNFPEQMPGFPVHPQRHPPGLPLLFALTRQFFDRQPELAVKVSRILRPYQCHNLALMNLPNSAIASATIQMLLPLWLALMVWPLYYFGSLIYDAETGLRAALLWPVVPSVALWATRWNHFYALFTLLAFISLHIGLSRRRLSAFLICGLVVSLATFLSFGNLALVGFLAIYALIWFMTQTELPIFPWLLLGLALLLFGLVFPWIAVWLIFDFDAIATLQNGLATHLDLRRSYTTWLFYHLYDFFVFLGIPLLVVWAAGTVRALRELRRGAVDVLAISALLGLLLLNLSGTSQGEVARVWAFLIPLFLLVAVRTLSDKRFLFFSIVTLLLLQLFVSNIFLRPVGTGLLDPPSQPAAATPSSAESLGIWKEGPVLQSVEMPKAVTIGQPINVKATWSTNQQIHRPYTIFVHLVDEEGLNLVAQQDGLPLSGEYLTTCWRTGESFSETYRITAPANVEAGNYQLLAGFYWLPTGERLELSHPTGQIDNSLSLGHVELVKRASAADISNND